MHRQFSFILAAVIVLLAPSSFAEHEIVDHSSETHAHEGDHGHEGVHGHRQHNEDYIHDSLRESQEQAVPEGEPFHAEVEIPEEGHQHQAHRPHQEHEQGELFHEAENHSGEAEMSHEGGSHFDLEGIRSYSLEDTSVDYLHLSVGTPKKGMGLARLSGPLTNLHELARQLENSHKANIKNLPLHRLIASTIPGSL